MTLVKNSAAPHGATPVLKEDHPLQTTATANTTATAAMMTTAMTAETTNAVTPLPRAAMTTAAVTINNAVINLAATPLATTAALPSNVAMAALALTMHAPMYLAAMPLSKLRAIAPTHRRLFARAAAKPATKPTNAFLAITPTDTNLINCLLPNTLPTKRAISHAATALVSR